MGQKKRHFFVGCFNNFLHTLWITVCDVWKKIVRVLNNFSMLNWFCPVPSTLIRAGEAVHGLLFKIYSSLLRSHKRASAARSGSVGLCIYWPIQHPFEGGLVHIELFLVFQNFVQEGAVLFIQIVVRQIVVCGEGLDVDVLTGKLQTKSRSTLHYKSI